MSVYAQEYGYFFNSNNSDRKYNAESFETWLKPFFVSGVFTGGLQVSAQSTPDMTVQVSAGYANLDGKLGYWNEANTLELATASGVYNRIDTIVLRRDNTNRRVSIEVVTGTASASPQPTAPTRTSDIFELVLAEILVVSGATEITGSKITDKRPDEDVCGYVVAAVQTPDFSELYAQFSAQAEEFMGDQAADFLAWFDEMKDQLSEDAAGHLQLEIDAINDEIGNTALPTTAQTLSGAIAENCQEISRLQSEIGIVINGNTATINVESGQYVILKNSTITGKTDGLYIYNGSTTKTAGNAFSSSELDECTKGIANELNDNLTNLTTSFRLHEDVTAVDGTFVYTGISITIPAKSEYAMKGMSTYANNVPKGALISTSNTSIYDWEVYAKSADNSCCCNLVGYANTSITFYLWCKWSGSSTNGAFLDGWYRTKS